MNSSIPGAGTGRYQRAQTLREHHQIACKVLGFRWASEHERLALLRAIREELARTGDRNRLLRFARQWMYEHQLIIVHERQLRSMIAAVDGAPTYF